MEAPSRKQPRLGPALALSPGSPRPTSARPQRPYRRADAVWRPSAAGTRTRKAARNSRCIAAQPGGDRALVTAPGTSAEGDSQQSGGCREAQDREQPDPEAYCLAGLRSILDECEEAILAAQSQPSTSLCRTASWEDPRPCSVLARPLADDTTVEDLVGYLKNCLYIPKKMSIMAEMMYS